MWFQAKGGWLPAQGAATSHSGLASGSEGRAYLLGGLGPGEGWRGQSLPGPRPALPALLLLSPLSVLPKRVIEEIPKSKPGTQYQRFRSLKPSECLNPKDALRGFLLEMLIWGFVFLILGFATS